MEAIFLQTSRIITETFCGHEGDAALGLHPCLNQDLTKAFLKT